MNVSQNPAFHIHASDWLRAKKLRDDTYHQRKQAIAAHKRKLQRYKAIKQALEKELNGFKEQLNRIDWKRDYYETEMQSIKQLMAECLDLEVLA